MSKSDKFNLLYFIIAVGLIFMLFSCGQPSNTSWSFDNQGICNEIPYSYSRITFYHLTYDGNQCFFVYHRNEAGFVVSDYMTCNFGSNDGTWSFFKSEEECKGFTY